MNAIDTLKQLATGNRVQGALLPPCRLDGWGGEAYGEEAIVNRFRQDPLDISDASHAVVSAHHAAVFAGNVALFADLYDGGILRIWRLGPGPCCPVEPAIGVAFDTDLHQARRDVAFRADDHIDLADGATDAILQIGYDIAHGRAEGVAPDWRTRPFVLRAFSAADTHAVLFAVHRVGPGQHRSNGFSFVAAYIAARPDDRNDPRIVRDIAGEKTVERAEWRTGF
ncbi:MAG: hypothetical protein WA948_12370 [Pontixanthobacter sp.]